MPYEKTMPCRSPDVGAGLKPALSKDRQFYLDVLKSNECACGREKSPRKAFCGRCYYALSGDLQVDIQAFTPIAKFEKAYEASIKYLEEKGIV